MPELISRSLHETRLDCGCVLQFGGQHSLCAEGVLLRNRSREVFFSITLPADPESRRLSEEAFNAYNCHVDPWHGFSAEEIRRESEALKGKVQACGCNYLGDSKWRFCPVGERCFGPVPVLRMTDPSEPRSLAEAGFVYFIRAENGLYKIGRSVDPDERLRSLQTASPVELRLIGTISTGDSVRLEAAIHRKLASVRVRGEWFDLEQRGEG